MALHKTRGIVINYIRYKETSVIVKIYTEQFGIQSYIENGVRSSKSKNKIALFQPLTLLDLVVYHKKSAGQQLYRIAEIKCNHAFQSIPFEFGKSSIAMFVVEMLGKCLKEETANEPLFDFIHQSIIWLDQAKDQFGFFHLIFLLRFSSYLGFAPLDAQEIVQQLHETNYKTRLDQPSIVVLDQLIESDYADGFLTNRDTRNILLESILFFYDLHIDALGEIKSLAVLREVMK
jgi:DNA repair protein RecO (recombination protein O)